MRATMNKRRMTAGRAGIALAVMTLGAVAFGACASSADTDPTPVTTFKITPAPPGYTPPTPSGATAPAASPSVAPTSPAGSATEQARTATTLELTASNITFDKTKMEASAGAVTIKVDNKDGGVPHNVHVFKGSSASGESIGATPLGTGPDEQTLDLRLAAGDYFYQCDVHPTTMAGTLSVS
jgi:plastocyanin